MLTITTIPAAVLPAELEGKKADKVVLTWEQRRWTRGRITTAGGREIGLALPSGTVLQGGSILCIEPEWYALVEAAQEPTLAIFPRDRAMALRVAFEVGNRHFPLAIEPDALLVPDDPAMIQLIERLGVPWEPRNAVFAPMGSAHRHDH